MNAPEIEPPLCLGIESTAHTFGASLVDSSGRVITNVNSTYKASVGVGIHPRKAAQHHAEVAGEIVGRALRRKSRSAAYLPDFVAYSAGPGLGPCLRVGATVARAIADFLSVPLFPVHHGIAHLDLAISVTKTSDPLGVLVSGGHTGIVVHLGSKWLFYGETQDITLGNILDMFAREARLPSPGGAFVESLAVKGKRILPLPYTVKGNDVSYSGLLTSALQLLKKGEQLADICYSLQEVGFSMLAEAVERSLVQTRKREVLLAGGVAANRRLRNMIRMVAEDHDAVFHPVPPEYAGDCGAQIAISGQFMFEVGEAVPVSKSHVMPRWRLDEAEVPWIPRP